MASLRCAQRDRASAGRHSWDRGYAGRVAGARRRLAYRAGRRLEPRPLLREGDLDVSAIVAALVASGYDGWLSMELWHPASTGAQRSMVEDVRRSVDYLRRLVGQAHLARATTAAAAAIRRPYNVTLLRAVGPQPRTRTHLPQRLW